MAERVRFELTERSSRSPAFEAGAFNHSTTSPWDGFSENDRCKLAPLAEEPLQLGCGFRFQYSGGDLNRMVKRRVLNNVQDAAGCASFGIAASEDQAFDTRRHHSSGAHDTGLFGNVDRSLGQPPRLQLTRRLLQNDHFGMRCCVWPTLLFVLRFEHYIAANEYSTDRNIPDRFCQRGQVHRPAYIVFVKH